MSEVSAKPPYHNHQKWNIGYTEEDYGFLGESEKTG